MEPTKATTEDFEGILEQDSLRLPQDEYLAKWVDYLKTFTFRGNSIDTTTLQEGIRGEMGNRYKLMALYGKTFPDQLITRTHLVRQLVNMVNDKSLYVYIPLRRVGSYGIPSKCYDWLNDAKTLKELDKPILVAKRIVENDDRYRAVEDHRSIVFIEDVDTYLGTNDDLKTKIKLVRDLFESYDEQARIYSLTYDEQPGLEDIEKKQPVKQNDVTGKKSTTVVTTKPTTTTTKKTREDYEKEIDELKKKLHLAEIRANDLQEATKSGSNSFAKNAEELKQTQQALNKANTEIKNKDGLIQQWREENTKINKELTAANIKVSDKEAEIQRIKTQGSNMASSEKQRLDDKVKELEEQIKNLLNGNTNGVIAGFQKDVKEWKELYEQSEKDRIDETNQNQKLRLANEEKIEKLENDLKVYTNMPKYELRENVSTDNGIASNYVGPIENLVMVRKSSISRMGGRLSKLNDMTYKASDMKIYRMVDLKTENLSLDNFYQVDNIGIRFKLEVLLQEELDSGTKAKFLDLQSEMLLASLADNFQNAYRGSETLTISFLVDGDLKTSLKISSLAFPVIADDEGLCAIPMHDTESHNKVYSAFSPLGKNVIASKGECIVERDGFEPLKFNYEMDRGELEGDIFHGRRLLISKDGIGLFTKFLSQEHLEIDKIVIIGPVFKEKKANILNYSSPITETNELEGEAEAEVFEVPIYPVEKSIISENLSISSTQGEEGDWPSGF